MMKRILSLVLCLCMLVGIAMLAGCGEKVVTEQTTLPATINMLGITGKETTPEAVKAVEDAINRITKNRYKTKVVLTLVTADEYIALVEARVAAAKQTKVTIEAIGKYNTLAVKDANRATKLLASQTKRTSKWTKEVRVEASTLSTGVEYTKEETIVMEDGRIETMYPDAESPIDIVMIADKDMYDYLDSKGYLLSIQKAVASGDSSTEFPKFKQYIYPTFFSQLAAVTGDVKAIPNNNLLAEYTYLLVDKALAEKYDLDINTVDSYDDLDAAKEGELSFLASVKKNESVAPFASEPDALGIYSFFEDDIPVGTYFHPIYGFNEQEGTDFKIRSIYSIPQYQEHIATMDSYRAKGYFAASENDESAVRVIKGDASVPAEYGDKYDVKVLQNPFVEVDTIFNGMMAVSSFTSDEKRAIRILEMFNTDSEAKNLLQYGIAYDGENDKEANYRVNTVMKEDGSVKYSIERLNRNYIMDNNMTGNVYMGYPEEGQSIDAWDYYKKTNLDSSLSPFLNFYMTKTAFNDMLSSIIRRAVMTENLKPLGIDFDEYEKQDGSSLGKEMRHNFKVYHKVYFVDALVKEGAAIQPINLVFGKTISPLATDFKDFLLSKEGQEIFVREGFTAFVENPTSYVKKADLSGNLKLCALISGLPTGYFDSVSKALVTAYAELNPAVTVTGPDKTERDGTASYLTDMNNVLNGSFDVGFLNAELTSIQKGLGLSSAQVAKSVLSVFNDDSNRTYSFTWYENKMIEDAVAKEYSKIVSASGLELMISNKLGELAGIDLSKYSEKSRPASETVVYNQARTQADAYYNNIAYLRIMTEMLLWNDLPESELDAYRKLNDVDFTNAVYDYVQKNYEKENNLTEEGYTSLVRDFMVSVLEYTNPTDKSTTYSVSWDDFQKTKEDAQVYIKAAETIKAQYYDKLVKKLGAGYLKLLSLPEVMDQVYDIMYEEYLQENGLDKKAFENTVKDKYFTAVGTDAEEFAGFAKTSDEYKNFLSKLRKKYKNLLVETFSSEAYKKGDTGITNTEILNTLFAHYLEEELKLNDKMCAIADINPSEFAAAKTDVENYTMYLGTLKTMFVYTLRTEYTQAQIDAWSFEEIETNLYNVLYKTGFYTNEMAKYIGQSLSDYMKAKSQATTYTAYVTKAVNALAPELRAKGYDPAKLVGESRETIEAALTEIIAEKYFGDRVQMQDVLREITASYVKGLENATDRVAYLKEADEALKSNSFYTAVAGALEAAWKEAKASASK